MDVETCLYNTKLSVGELINQARVEILAVRQPTLETFVPLYLTNYCDGFCRICNMRITNKKLHRLQGNRESIREQLFILRNIENISAVCLLSGEYNFGEQRVANLQVILWSIKEAFEHGFEKIYVNIGALTTEEIQILHNHFSDSSSSLVLSLFQETYDRKSYSKFFGGNEEQNPKADYDMRLSTPTRWISQGFVQVDIGILLGLLPPHSDVDQLVKHATFLHKRGAEVAISLPRLRGLKRHPYSIDDDLFKRIVAYIGIVCPWARIIITTREDITMIRELLSIVSIVSPGSSDIIPYTKTGLIPNRKQTSQFQVASMRPRPSWTLNNLHVEAGAIKYFKSKSFFEEKSIV